MAAPSMLQKVLSAAVRVPRGLVEADIARLARLTSQCQPVVERYAWQLVRSGLLTNVKSKSVDHIRWVATSAGRDVCDAATDVGALPCFTPGGEAWWPGVDIWVWLDGDEAVIVSLNPVDEVEPTNLALPSDPTQLKSFWKAFRYAQGLPSKSNGIISGWLVVDESTSDQWVSFDQPLSHSE